MDNTPWWATGAFWAGIVISAVLSIFINVLTNIYNSKVQDLLENRKVISHEKRRSKAVRVHKLVVQLHSGERDKTRYVVLQCTTILFAFIAAATSLTATFVILALAPLVDHFDLADPIQLRIWAVVFILTLLAYFSITIVFIRMIRLNRVGNAVAKFAEYEKAFKERWGERQIH